MKELIATIVVGLLGLIASYNLAMLLVKAAWAIEKVHYKKRKK